MRNALFAICLALNLVASADANTGHFAGSGHTVALAKTEQVQQTRQGRLGRVAGDRGGIFRHRSSISVSQKVRSTAGVVLPEEGVT